MLKWLHGRFGFLDFNDDNEEGAEDEVIESKMVGRPSFPVNLQFNQEEAICLAEKSVRLHCELHPLINLFC